MLLRSIVVEREPIYGAQETVHGFAPAQYGLSAEETQQPPSDDRIGRALDRLFDVDRAALLTAMVVAVGARFGAVQGVAQRLGFPLSRRFEPIGDIIV